MSFLKSVYVVAFIIGSVTLTLYAGLAIYGGGPILAWGGVLLTIVPFVLTLGWIMAAKRTARTSARFPRIIALGALGVGLTLWSYWQQSGPGLAVILAGFGWLSFLGYSYWYSSFTDRSSQIEVGRTLPDFTLINTKGDTLRTSDLANKASIFMFYRGNWCPLCVAQIKEITAIYQQLEAANIRIALISPQPHKYTIGLAKKFNVGFEFYTDTGNKAARILGISSPFGLPFGLQAMGYDSETVLPTIIITDANGTVLWTDETDNYRVRPEPDVFLAVLRQHGITV